MRTVLFLTFVATLLVACNNRSRGGGGTPIDPLCPDGTVSTGEFCDVDQSGITCAGTVSCPCGERSTTCVCAMDGVGGYGFSCVDSCSCPTGDSGPGSAQCGSVYDRIQASACPFSPDTVSRAEFVAQCDASGGMSASCRAELDSFLACALSAPIVCEDVGDGMRFPTIPDCPPVSSSCFE